MMPLVTIISPCYNVESYVARFLESLLSQTYGCLEVVLVNDGSTDGTAGIISKYLPLLEQKGYRVVNVEQANAGLAGAINSGLKHITGKYLMWPDPDDWLVPNAVEKFVSFMESHPQVDIVRGRVKKIEAESGKSMGCFGGFFPQSGEIRHFFRRALYVQTWLAPVGYMLRVASLDRAIPGREIYVHPRAGQNWQLMLPLAYRGKVFQIRDFVGYYYVRKDSHSRILGGYGAHLFCNEVYEQVLLRTLSRIPGTEEWQKKVRIEYAKKRILLSKQYVEKAGLVAGIRHYLAESRGVMAGIHARLWLLLPWRLVMLYRRLRRRIPG